MGGFIYASMAAAPPTGAVQFNNGGVLGGSGNFTYNPTNNQVHISNPNNVSTTILESGSTLGIRFGQNGTTNSVIEGVDSTGTGSYQPLVVGGSTIALSIQGNNVISVSNNKNVTHVAPTAGVGLTLNSISGGVALATTGDVTITQQAATTGGNLSITGQTGGVNRLRYLTSGGANSTFALRDDTAGTDRLTIAGTGGVTIATPGAAAATLTLNQTAGGANVALAANGSLSAAGDMGSATSLVLFNQSTIDGRAVILFRSDLTASQQWLLGLDTSGGSTKSFSLRNVTGATTPLTCTTGGNWTLAAPTSGDLLTVNGQLTVGSTTLIKTNVALTNNAAAAAGTLTNAPVAGNPTKWIPINDNGTIRNIPAW